MRLLVLAQWLLALHALSVLAVDRVPLVAQREALGAQVADMELEINSGGVALHHVRLQGGRIAAVTFLPSSQGAQDTVALDWEQQYHAGPSAAALRAGGSYSLLAVLPTDDSGPQPVSRVVAYCEDCSGFSGTLATAEVQPGPPHASGGTVTFVFQGVQLRGAAAVGGAGSRGRELQQAPAAPTPQPLPDCSLQVGDQQLTFEGCQAAPLNPNALYQIYYTLTPSDTGGTRWSGGLKIDAAAVGGQWAGFGFPQFPSTMLGADAIIVKQCAACPSGASVDGYSLVGYSPADNVAGSFNIAGASAARATDGTLVAAFTADLPQPPDQLLAAPGGFNFIFAIGTLAADESLLPHPSPDRPYGGMRLNLSAGISSQAPAPDGAAPESAAAGISPAPAPASSSPPPPGRASSPPPAPGPKAEGAADGAAAGCQLSLGGQPVSFAACTPIQGVGDGFSLMWTLEPPAGNTSTLALGLMAAAGGWVAVGFPATEGRMLGSTAMILKTCTACASGAEIGDYFLAQRSPSGVQPPGQLAVSDASASTAGDGTMHGTIKVQLDSAAASNPAFPIILAAGRLDSSGGLQYHDSRGASTANWASGTSGSVEGEAAHITRMKNAHGWLMATGWGMLIPLGILTARHGKGVKPPLWFHMHRAIQVLGMSCALAGFILIFVAVQQATGTSVSTYTVHRRLGISAMSMGFFQLFALVLRPHPGTRLRKYWEPVHHWVGRAAAVVAVANIYEGIINVYDVGTWAVATYSVIFGLIVAAGLGLDAYKLLGGAGEGSPPGSLPGAAASDRNASEPGTDKGSSQGIDKFAP